MSRQSLKRGVSGMALAAAVALVAETGASAATGEKAYDFNIPGGSLSSVVTAIARTGGRLITFPPSVASGRQARPVVGHETVSQAISQAIAGSGLRLVVGVGGELTLKESGGTQGGTSNAATDIADIDVTGNGSPLHDNGYQAGDAGATVRIADAPAKEIPISVSSVTSDVLKDQATTNVTDATQNIAGVTQSPSDTGTPTFNIRGFTNSAGQDGGDGLSVDGDRTDQFSTIPIDDVQRLDVLKGPTSILTGQGSGGGLVNIVTKEPTDRTIRDVTVRYGSYNYKTLAFDLGGIVPGYEGLTYRFNTSANNADQTFGGYRDPHQFLISPALKWEDKDTSVLVGFRYVDTRTPHPQETFAPGFSTDPNGILRLPRGVAEGNPYFALNAKTKNFYSDQSHDFGSLYGVDFTLNNHVKYLITNAAYNNYFFGFQDNNVSFGGGPFGPNETSIDPYSAFFQQTRLSERVDLTLKYDVGFLKQTSKFGYDYSRQSSAGNVYGQDFDNTSTVNYLTGQPGISIPTPNQYVNNSFGDTFNNEREADRNTTSGIYYLEKVDTLNDRLHILGSVRDDHFYSHSQTGFPDGGFNNKPTGSSQYAVSYAAGGAFDVTPWLTLYGNRSNGFTAQFGTDSATGQALPPQGRDLSEVGARFFLLDKRLSLTTSFYNLAQTNQAIANPNGVFNSFIVLPGELSRGFEFEAQGQILPGWNVTAAFTAIGANYIEPTAPGTQVSALPHYVGSVFTTYTVQEGPLSGFLFGFGAHGNTSSVTGSINDFGTLVNLKVPGYVVEDAVIGYTHDNYSLNFKLNNLTNQYYFYPSYGPFNVPIGQGRNFVLTAKTSF